MSDSNVLRNMKRLHRILMLTACAVLAGCSQSSSIDEEANKLLSTSEMTALSVTFVADGVVTTYHFGQFPDDAMPSDDTIYDIGSITKTHVGLLLAQAVSDGKIGLDTPISQYLRSINSDALTFQDTEITVRHLATHTSGLPTDLSCGNDNLKPDERLECLNNHDDEHLLKVLNDYKLQEKPGKKYHYSNSGIRLIGLILEELYDSTLEQLLHDIVFTSTGQIETYTHLTKNQHLRWRRGSHENGLSTPDASGYFNAAGGLKSTAQDMGRYISFYVNTDNQLAKKTLTMLAGEEDGLGRAYMWNTFRLDSEGQYYHGGGTFGTSAWISIYPEEKLGIFLVSPYASATTQEKLNRAANNMIEIYRRQR